MKSCAYLYPCLGQPDLLRQPLAGEHVRVVRALELCNSGVNQLVVVVVLYNISTVCDGQWVWGID